MKVLKNILFWMSTVCFVLAIAAVAIPKLFGVEFRAVVSGSMTPEIPVGSLVVVVPTKAEDIEIGDDITFVSASEMVVTHRVVAINRETNEFTTWGIANDPSAIDAPNRYENIIGVVKLHVPFVGRIFTWFSTTYGKIITATAIVAAFLLSTILGLWSKSKKGGFPEENSGNDGSEKRFDDLLDSFAESEALFEESRAVALKNDDLPVRNASEGVLSQTDNCGSFPASSAPTPIGGLPEENAQGDAPASLFNDDTLKGLFEANDQQKKN